MTTLSPVRLMGIVNVTPDSFSEGGSCFDSQAAIDRALLCIDEGADLIDVGGESTRPGAAPVSADEELRRVIPVVAGIRRVHATIPLSVDTTKAAVAHHAVAAGATMINDISAGCSDPEMFAVVAAGKVDVVLMHMQGTPATMQVAPQYDDVVADVTQFLRARVAAAEQAGIPRFRCYIDPGIGFGKTPDHNIALLRALPSFVALGLPVVLGVSRKSIIGHLLGGAPVADRLEGSLALAGWAAQSGVSILRVHDVAATRRFLRVWGIFSAHVLPSRPNTTT